MTLDIDAVDPKFFRECALGLTLSRREVGIAVATGEHVLASMVLDLKKFRTQEAKEKRLSRFVEPLIDEFAVTRVAIVADGAVYARTETEWLAGEIDARSIPGATYQAEDVRRHFCGPRGRTSNERLAEVLVDRFPALVARAPSAEPVPGAGFVDGLRKHGRSDRSRYHARMFLALGASILALDDALKMKLGI
jgi:hypothetical protein